MLIDYNSQVFHWSVKCLQNRTLWPKQQVVWCLPHVPTHMSANGPWGRPPLSPCGALCPALISACHRLCLPSSGDVVTGSFPGSLELACRPEAWFLFWKKVHHRDCKGPSSSKCVLIWGHIQAAGEKPPPVDHRLNPLEGHMMLLTNIYPHIHGLSRRDPTI